MYFSAQFTDSSRMVGCSKIEKLTESGCVRNDGIPEGAAGLLITANSST